MSTVTINVPSQVKTYANLAAFPVTGSEKTIYIALDTSIAYYWTGVVYSSIGGSSSSATTTEVFEVTGTTITLADEPISAAVYKNGQRLNPTSVGSYAADYSISGNTITLAVAADADLFLIENTH